MSQTNFKQRPEYEYGAVAQRAVAERLKSHGFSVVYLHDIENGGAPVLNGGSEQDALPDLDVGGFGHSFYCEVKRKTTCGFYENFNRKTHFISGDAWKAYFNVQRKMGRPVLLVICEDDTGEMLANWLNKLLDWGVQYGEMKKGGVVDDEGVYINRKALRPLDDVAQELAKSPQYARELPLDWGGQ